MTARIIRSYEHRLFARVADATHRGGTPWSAIQPAAASMLRVRYSPWNGTRRANESVSEPGAAGCATVFNY